MTPNSRRYNENTERISGGLVLGIAMFTSSRDLHEMLHAELLSCNYINSSNPGDIVSAMNYILKSEDENVEPWDLENVVVRTTSLLLRILTFLSVSSKMDYQKNYYLLEMPI